MRAAKPEPPLSYTVDEAAVEVTLERAPEPGPEDEDEHGVSAAVRRRSRERPRAGYLGLGSNVGDRAAQISAALTALPAEGIEVEAVSSLYETEPVGEVLDQPDFLNAAARIRTALEPEELLDACKRIEAAQGREAGGPRHGPRPIDIDLLLLGDVELETDRLTLPHPEVRSRRFVLLPLLELDPALSLPDGTKLKDALDALGKGQEARLYSAPPALNLRESPP